VSRGLLQFPMWVHTYDWFLLCSVLKNLFSNYLLKLYSVQFISWFVSQTRSCYFSRVELFFIKHTLSIWFYKIISAIDFTS
jgi:hypothetical protein